jgi:hypothetical protein
MAAQFSKPKESSKPKNHNAISESAALSDSEPKGVSYAALRIELGCVKTERKLVRKLDLHIITLPVVMLLYVLSFLDRYSVSDQNLDRWG